jgi:xyloglucan fucosyltransferase
MEGLFCEPFPGTSWLLPLEFPYKEDFSWKSKDIYMNMLENGVVSYDDGGNHYVRNTKRRCACTKNEGA